MALSALGKANLGPAQEALPVCSGLDEMRQDITRCGCVSGLADSLRAAVERRLSKDVRWNLSGVLEGMKVEHVLYLEVDVHEGEHGSPLKTGPAC